MESWVIVKVKSENAYMLKKYGEIKLISSVFKDKGFDIIEVNLFPGIAKEMISTVPGVVGVESDEVFEALENAEIGKIIEERKKSGKFISSDEVFEGLDLFGEAKRDPERIPRKNTKNH